MISYRYRTQEPFMIQERVLAVKPGGIAAVILLAILVLTVAAMIDSAEAAFEVDDYVNYVHVQSESALRNLATHHPYDAHADGQTSLRGNTAEVAQQLQKEIQVHLRRAGVEVVEARITHLAYAPE